VEIEPEDVSAMMLALMTLNEKLDRVLELLENDETTEEDEP